MSSPKPNDRYYRRLEVGPHASQAEIVGAYRRLAQGAHPDTHPEDPEAPQRFREITEAYEVLTNPTRRARDHHDRGQDPSGPIRVVVRRTADPSQAAAVGRTDPPLVLGAPAHAEGRLLRAGPVRIEPGTQAVSSGRVHPGAATNERLLRLFSDLFESFWRF